MENSVDTHPETYLLTFRLLPNDEKTEKGCAVLVSEPQLPGVLQSLILHNPEEWEVEDIRIGRNSILLGPSPISGPLVEKLGPLHQPFDVGQHVRVLLKKLDTGLIALPAIVGQARLYKK